jgi:hypothetical protein
VVITQAEPDGDGHPPAVWLIVGGHRRREEAGAVDVHWPNTSFRLDVQVASGVVMVSACGCLDGTAGLFGRRTVAMISTRGVDMAMGRVAFTATAMLAAVVLAGTSSVAQAAGTTVGSATGTVFFPNPVQQLGRQDLTDNKDADDPVFASAYRRVTLTDLDGSGRLSGTYVRVKSTTGKAAVAVNGVFPDFHRDSDQFEQVMGYFWVTTAQRYLQHLGFGSDLRAVNQRQIEVRINQFGGDNSFFRDDKANITLGKGGVDDAEDAEVIVHEYGHSVQDGQVPGFGTNLESGAIGEGFSDYLAVVVTSWTAGFPR